jgi:hypothetical protein
MTSKITTLDRDEFLKLERAMVVETEKVLDDTLREFDATADAAADKTIAATLADFQSELDELRSEISELEKDATLNNQAIRALITAALSGEGQ